MKMDEVSAELRAIGSEYGLKRLYELADAIDHRDKPMTLTPSDELAAKVRKYRLKNPDVGDVQLSFRFGISLEAVKAIFAAPKPYEKPVSTDPITIKIKQKVKK
jgi:hypothetical protein